MSESDIKCRLNKMENHMEKLATKEDVRRIETAVQSMVNQQENYVRLSTFKIAVTVLTIILMSLAGLAVRSLVDVSAIKATLGISRIMD